MTPAQGVATTLRPAEVALLDDLRSEFDVEHRSELMRLFLRYAMEHPGPVAIWQAVEKTRRIRAGEPEETPR